MNRNRIPAVFGKKTLLKTIKNNEPVKQPISEYTDFIAKGINNITIVADEKTDEKHAAMLIVELRNQIRLNCSICRLNKIYFNEYFKWTWKGGDVKMEYMY